MDGTVVLGVVAWVALALAPAVVVTIALHGGRVTRLAGRLLRRVPRAARPAPAVGRPLEQVAADLRRLHPAVHHPPPGTRMVKQRGVVLAYDEHLVAAATALLVGTSLLQLPVGGVDRELERLRLEHALVAAGLVISP